MRSNGRSDQREIGLLSCENQSPRNWQAPKMGPAEHPPMRVAGLFAGIGGDAVKRR